MIFNRILFILFNVFIEYMEGILANNIPSIFFEFSAKPSMDEQKFKNLIRKKGRHVKKAEKSGMDKNRARYFEQMVKRELQDAERVYVNGILQNDLESRNNKSF